MYWRLSSKSSKTSRNEAPLNLSLTRKDLTLSKKLSYSLFPLSLSLNQKIFCRRQMPNCYNCITLNKDEGEYDDFGVYVWSCILYSSCHQGVAIERREFISFDKFLFKLEDLGLRPTTSKREKEVACIVYPKQKAM